MRKIKILHLASIDKDKTKGTSTIIPEYFTEQSINENIDVYFINCNGNNLNLDNFENYFYTSKTKEIKNIIFEIRPDIIVFHEIYKRIYLQIYKNIIYNNIPYVIVPHGSLTYFALMQKRIKKNIANYLFFDDFINKANKIQFLSEIEKTNSPKYNKNSIIIGNGKKNIYNINLYEQLHFEYSSNQFFDLIYVGRYDCQIKGLDQLIKSFIYIRDKSYNNIRLNLFGKGTEDNINKIKELVTLYNLESHVIINGPIYGEEKEKKIVSSDMFIQVSRSEGQPLGVIEALSLGVPCILSMGTGFSKHIKENKIGYITETDALKISNTIITAYENRVRLIIISENCYNFARERYSWRNITEYTLKKYIEIINK